MKCFHAENIFFYLINANLKLLKQILYHIMDIRQIKYKNKVWFFLQFLAFQGIIGCILYVIKMSMKKLFIQLWQWILKYKKRLLYGALALFIGQICFLNLWWIGLNNFAYAEGWNDATQNTSFQNKTSGWAQKLSFYQRGIYILLYPILALAWALVNNSMVYAEVFSFDVVLWQLWNVMRNIANYALWFIFVFKIFRFLTHWQKSSDMKDLLTSSLIAWIWIQASWFILAVLIDISNILAYGVWWLPIKTLWQQTEFGNPYVMKTVIYTDLVDPDSMFFYLSNTSTGEVEWGSKYYIAECRTFSYRNNSNVKELILAPKIVYYYDTSYKATVKDKCHLWDDVYYLNGFVEGINWPSDSIWKDAQIAYAASLEEAINKLNGLQQGAIINHIEGWRLLEIWNAHGTWGNLWVHYNDSDKIWLDVDNNWSGAGGKLAKLKDVLKWDYLWVFSALYSSLLNAWTDLRVTNGSDTWIYASLLNTALSFWYVIAIGIPLIAMVVVFFMRIGVIWMAIILSPVIILLKAFKFEERATKHVGAYKYLTVKNLIGIIFSPAIVCFAVSISTVLVRIISAVNIQEVMTEEQPILWWIIKLDIGWLWLNIGRLISCVIWVAISRFLVWAAVKASALWETKIIESIKNFAGSALWSIPIVPVPWKDWVNFVWVNAARQIPWKLESKIRDTYGWESDKAVNDLINSSWVSWRKADAYESQIGNFTPVSGTPRTLQWVDITSENWSYKQSFEALPGEKKAWIIEAINGLDMDKRKAFGGSAPQINFNDWTKEVRYQFVEKNEQWEDFFKYKQL